MYETRKKAHQDTLDKFSKACSELLENDTIEVID